MDRACRGQQQVAGSELLARLLHPEEPGTAHDHVKLVAPVRLLRVEAAGRIDLHLQSTALVEDAREALPIRGGQATERFLQRDPDQATGCSFYEVAHRRSRCRASTVACLPSDPYLRLVLTTGFGRGGGTVSGRGGARRSGVWRGTRRRGAAAAYTW